MQLSSPTPNKNQNHGTISVVVPVFDEKDSLPELVRRLDSVLSKLGNNYEIILVNDGSQDGSLAVMQDLFDQFNQVVVVNLRRNFGKSAALSAGFSVSQGDIIVTIDADLQDQPEEIPNLLDKLNQDYDLISGWKANRQDSLGKKLWSRIFNATLRLFTGIKIHDINCGLKVYRREVIELLPLYGDLHRFLPVFAHSYGFRVGEVKVKHEPRRFGKSKFGSSRIWRGMLDFITILLLTKFTHRPGHFFGSVGFLSFGIGFLTAAYLTVLWFLGERPIGNRPLLFLAILLIVVGIQLVSLGLLGELIVSQRRSSQDEIISKVYKHEH